MDNIVIENVEYVVPIPDRPVGSLAFQVKGTILYNPERKALGDSEDSINFSETTVELIKQLSESIIKDMEAKHE